MTDDTAFDGTPREEGRVTSDERSMRWVIDGALDAGPTVVLAHGAGAGMEHPWLVELARSWCAAGLTVVRFHFPYMQRREDEGSRKPPDRAPRLLDAWRAVLDEVVARRSAAGAATPLVLAGKSMGARMASMLLAEGRAPEAAGGVWLGYPLHPSGHPEKEGTRAAHLPDVPVPQLFVWGSRDALAEGERLGEVVAGLPAARLLEVPGGDHSLARRKKDAHLSEVDWVAETAAFVHGLG